MPQLAQVTRLYAEVKLMSCQSERKFSALINLIGNLRSSISAFKAEHMLLRLNQYSTPEIKKVHKRTKFQVEGRKTCIEYMKRMQSASPGTGAGVEIKTLAVILKTTHKYLVAGDLQ